MRPLPTTSKTRLPEGRLLGYEIARLSKVVAASESAAVQSVTSHVHGLSHGHLYRVCCVRGIRACADSELYHSIPDPARTRTSIMSRCPPAGLGPGRTQPHSVAAAAGAALSHVGSGLAQPATESERLIGMSAGTSSWSVDSEGGLSNNCRDSSQPECHDTMNNFIATDGQLQPTG